ncbi:hypothetical protein QUA56_23165 [Microcoleus sp. N3A4]|uniref:hypothetical protein n=1 Tax=Microcoleus sp. N3A4 TaxID=3055379 RepID=UPI002FD2BDBC
MNRLSGPPVKGLLKILQYLTLKQKYPIDFRKTSILRQNPQSLAADACVSEKLPAK